MMNIEQITSRLAKLPDQALQQYASMHKNDPYVMALALSESNRRKQMRVAAQGQQGGEQPKVVDQELAGMLPEDTGIARLPTGNMDFAGGGIVAFADGGQPAHLPMAGAAQYSRHNMFPGPTPYEGMGILEFLQQAGSDAWSALPDEWKDDGTKAAARRHREAQEAKAAENMRGYKPRRTDDAKAFAVEEADTVARAPAPTNKPPPAPPNVKDEATRRTTGAAAMPGGVASLASLQKQLEAMYGGKYTNPTDKEDAALIAEQLKVAKESKAEGEAARAQFSGAFKGREERLDARENDITKSKDVNTGLAFLNAGLAIMSTPGGLATAIGKGARVGTEQFAAGLDKIRASKEKLDEARDRLDDLKLNQARMDSTEIRAENNAIRQVGIAALNMQRDGIREAAGVNNSRIKDVMTNAVSLFNNATDNQTRLQAARIGAAGAGRNNQLETLQALHADPKLMATYQTAFGNKDTSVDRYIKFLDKNPQYMANQKAGLSAFLAAEEALAKTGAGTGGTSGFRVVGSRPAP